MESLRIRLNNAIIKELKIPQEKIDKVKELFSKHYVKKADLIKKITGHGPCSSCGEMPNLQLSYDLQGAAKIERYCNRCIKQVYEGIEKGEPTDRKELQEYYNIQIGELPKSALT